MAADARLTALEAVVLGRAAMGERVTAGALSDHWRIRRDGRLVHAEALHAAGDLAAATAGPATLSGARALATIVHAAPGADARLDAARALLAPLDGVTAAATAKPDLLILRFLAADARPLRAALDRFLTAFRAGPLPRVWSS
jgi:urease accessory protein